MKRREFITLVGGAAVAWPLAARAQQPMPVIGFFRSTGAADFSHLVAAFQAGLNEAGYTEGRNVAVEYRWADGQSDRLPGLAAELIGRRVNVIVGNSIAALAAKAATTTVPIVFVTGADPVKDGLVESLNRPGRNVTGVTFLSGVLGAKRLELLRQIAPQATTIAALVYPHTTEAQAERRDLIAAAQSLGQQLLIVDVSNEAELEPAFATMPPRGVGAVLIGSSAFMNAHRDRVTALALRHALPSVFSQREFVTAGGLMSYGTNITDAYRQAGGYAARILKGEKPGDLPVQQPTKFEFVLNLKTAKTLGLTIPLTLQASADEAIE